MEGTQQIEMKCCHCKRPLALLFMNTLDDLCCLSIRCCQCQGKTIDWKQSAKTSDTERAMIWEKIKRMNNV
jgi:hypothetical protein